MSILSIDIGTTHIKAGLFQRDGLSIKLAFRPMHTYRSSSGWVYLDPDEIINSIQGLVKEIQLDCTDTVDAVGISGMAESGILIDKKTGEYYTKILPWFENVSQPKAEEILATFNPQDIYKKFGLRVTYKASLTKILWLKDQFNFNWQDKIWLSVADFVAWWLTGNFQTDVSLACRTLAFRLDQRDWDQEWLRDWGLPCDLFPPAQNSGASVGTINNPKSGLSLGTPVSICGHDHVCAAVSMGPVQPGSVFDSIGTAETLIGPLPNRPLTSQDYEIGLLYGCHTFPNLGYWLGGISSSGGSIEWYRRLLNFSDLGYEEMDSILSNVNEEPTQILYFPYLLGSSSPHTQPSARAALIGLNPRHTAADIYKAILEGTAFELEVVRRAGEKMSSEKITTLMSAGGGTRNRIWMQIKADVTGCDIQAALQPEATLLGAALLAGIENGIYHDFDDAFATIITQQSFHLYAPNQNKHRIYQDIFENGYLALQQPIRKYGSWIEQNRSFHDT